MSERAERARIGRRAAKALLEWYAANARDLPWRRDVDPYRVLVSEIMLQQTTVETVGPYFDRFLAAFPSVRDLAAAELGEVLALWSGLGYYSRARNLHAAARIIERDHAGRVPAGEPELLRLPGIGPYTAAAIASIAYGLPVLALDGNLRRVLARLIAYEGDVRAREGERALLRGGGSLPLEGDPSAINQALMDVGATLCTPRSPRCPICPLASHCEARRLGIAERIPAPVRRPEPLTVPLAAAILRAGSRILLRQRHGPLMAGLWEFPMVGGGDAEGLKRHLMRASGLRLEDLRRVGTMRHTITRHRLRIEIFEGSARPSRGSRAQAVGAIGEPSAPPWKDGGSRVKGPGLSSDLAGTSSPGPARWFDADELPALPLTGLAKKIVRAYGHRQGEVRRERGALRGSKREGSG